MEQGFNEEGNYQLKLSYIGTAYQGWQSQPEGKSIQDIVERGLGIVLGSPVRVISSSRTDSGVHAEEQICAFKAPLGLDLYKLTRSLNGLLPDDISVLGIEAKSLNFNPIFHSIGKVYRYFVWNGPPVPPFLKPYVWVPPKGLDVDRLKSELKSIEGTHDFTSMCASDSSAATRDRKILEVFVNVKGPLIEIWVIGEGFLKQMVRNIVGTAVDISRGKLDATMLEIISQRDRTKGGITAPARGLFLVKVLFEEIPSVNGIVASSCDGFCLNLPL